tara:strand:+ start:272 stop:589 length:318 start_codon:yes stop_codon:yes gene_type:complete
MEQDKYLKRLRDTHAMMLGRYTLSNVARLMDSWIPDSNPYMEALCRAAHSDPVLVLDMLQPVIEINSLASIDREPGDLLLSAPWISGPGADTADSDDKRFAKITQ